MVSPPVWTSSAGILSTPADFPFFSDATALSTSSRRIGCRYSSGGWLQSSTALSPWPSWLYSSEVHVYYVHLLRISFFSKTFPRPVLDSWGSFLFLWGLDPSPADMLVIIIITVIIDETEKTVGSLHINASVKNSRINIKHLLSPNYSFQCACAVFFN